MYIDSTGDDSGRFALNAANADTADKLNTSAGGALQPIYFQDGKPVAISNSVGSSAIPAYLSGGKFVACSYNFKDYLPKEAGKANKLTGMLGLTSGVCYGSEAPSDNTFEGALYFIEDPGYSLATANEAGLLKIGYSESNKNYAVKLDASGKAYVSVPWSDTTYTSLKNPYALTIQGNGTTLKTYDGSSAQTVNITPSSIGAAASSHSHSYLPLSGGTLSGMLNCFGGGLKIGTSSEPVTLSYDTSSDTLSITFP